MLREFTNGARTSLQSLSLYIRLGVKAPNDEHVKLYSRFAVRALSEAVWKAMEMTGDKYVIFDLKVPTGAYRIMAGYIHAGGSHTCDVWRQEHLERPCDEMMNLFELIDALRTGSFANDDDCGCGYRVHVGDNYCGGCGKMTRYGLRGDTQRL
jgi:hypothetical protein